MAEFNLDEVKKRYKELEKKYNLPPFEELNKNFYIEKIADSETDFLTREIRRFISDKVYNYLRFVETLINPANAPMFIFAAIKLLTPDDKKKLGEIYQKLSEIDLDLIRLDISSTEEEDVKFIMNALASWNQIKSDLSGIVKKINIVPEDKEEKNSGGYFG